MRTTFADLAANPVTPEEVEQIVAQLIALAIGGCTCEATATSKDLDAHAADCRYRVMSEAALIISKLAGEVEKQRPRESPPPLRDFDTLVEGIEAADKAYDLAIKSCEIVCSTYRLNPAMASMRDGIIAAIRALKVKP
jgi:hypothetical protein